MPRMERGESLPPAAGRAELFVSGQFLFACGHAGRAQASGARVANMRRVESAMLTVKVKDSILAIVFLPLENV
jgi:hypothetical protein